ncbi:uncharacterized protein LOC129938576 [Eupeodes corollae]|uniref:uncharacterized protein LOC129938576 n=1 Tax=Eupeodes corollae TaxID=290404 RepID=UPI002491931A|nr:uncharacterized protein LOC129938576 [Eupeodes corollae]
MGRAKNKQNLLIATALCIINKRSSQKIRRFQVHPLFHARKIHGEYFSLIERLELFPIKFFEYFRMSRQQFQCILLKIRSDIQPRFNLFRNDTISAKEKLCLTLRFLATGASFADLSFRFLMGKTTVRWCIMQTIQAINKHFTDLVMPVPESPSFWKEISLDFLSNWNFPNCLGAVDGKHVKMFAPRKSGSFNFNYKKCFSTILMAVVDANYKFIMVSIGAHASNADSTVFASSNFGKAWLSNPKSLFVPADQKLPSTENCLPFVLVGDEAFGLRYNLMTPFPGSHLTTKQRIFNYRLSRARRIVESTFGILVPTWRVLIKPLKFKWIWQNP